jgi:quercetin dioxygenase-like cupin family protein
MMHGIEAAAGLGEGQIVIRHANEGDPIWAVGSLFTIKLAAEESGGQLSVMRVISGANGATPLHAHHHEAEAFYLLDGEMTYQAGEQVAELRAGSFVFLPKGIPHRFRVARNTPATFLAFGTPGGVEHLYREVGVPAVERTIPSAPTPEEFARWPKAAPKYGLELLGPPLPE